jgi:epoxyqueuosine reductase QueG
MKGIPKEIAITPSVVGLKLYDSPVIAFASASDPLFLKLREPGVIGPHFLLPTDWLPSAKTVISFFLPFTERVRETNRSNRTWPSPEWLHGRIEGEVHLHDVCQFVANELSRFGGSAVIPSMDKRFSLKSPITDDQTRQEAFTSNWSERHVGYISGLGTFGLSRGLITARGMAGRIGSVVTSMEFEVTNRPYVGLYDYCSRCGACARKCPAGAISIERGKSHPECFELLSKVLAKERPRYGCGKCQVGVPCETKIPNRRFGWVMNKINDF